MPETKPLFRGILENIRVAVARVKKHPAKQEVRSR
jgi:hypothetical protein